MWLTSLFGFRFVTTSQARLSQAYRLATDYLDSLDLTYLPSGVGPFIVVDLRRLFSRSTMTFELESAIWEAALDNGVYVAQCQVFHVLEPGFFRLTYTLEWSQVKKGIDIFHRTIKSFVVWTGLVVPEFKVRSLPLYFGPNVICPIPFPFFLSSLLFCFFISFSFLSSLSSLSYSFLFDIHNRTATVC